MSQPPEGPPDPLKAQKNGLLRRVFMLRQDSRVLGNQNSQDALTEVRDNIKSAKTRLELDIIDAGLRDIEKKLSQP